MLAAWELFLAPRSMGQDDYAPYVTGGLLSLPFSFTYLSHPPPYPPLPLPFTLSP